MDYLVERFKEEYYPEEIKWLIRELKGAPLYLTGSRYFGTASLNSDWDFFIEDSDRAREVLLKHGFKESTGHFDYFDPFLICLFEKYISRSLPVVKIHIQLVRDADIKAKLQTVMSGDPHTLWCMHNKDKVNMSAFWTFAFKVARHFKS